jgi:hypothetical protein
MNDNEARLVHIVRPLDWTSALEIAAVIAGAWLLTVVVRAGLPWAVDRLRPAGRMKILPWIPVLRFLILLAAIGVIVPIVIRPTLENMVVIFGALGLAIGFAFKDYLSDVIGGAVAIIERAYRPGDWVRIDDAYGEVKLVGLRSLSIVTPDECLQRQCGEARPDVRCRFLPASRSRCGRRAPGPRRRGRDESLCQPEPLDCGRFGRRAVGNSLPREGVSGR